MMSQRNPQHSLHELDGYISDVPTMNSNAMSDVSNDLLASTKALEQQFKDKYRVLRNAYEQRIRQLSDVVQDSCANIMSDEVINEMKQDAASSHFIPRLIAESIEQQLDGEQEKYIHQLLSKMSSLEVELTKSAAAEKSLKSKMLVLERESTRGKQIEAAFNVVKERLVSLERQYESLRFKSEQENNLLKTARDDLQVRNARLESKMEESSRRLAEQTKELEAFRRLMQDRDREISILEQSYEHSTREIALVEGMDKHERTQNQELRALLNSCTEERNVLFMDIQDLRSRFRYASEEIVRYKEAMRKKTEEERQNQQKIAALMEQVEQILSQEASESNAAISTVHDKMKAFRHRMSSEISREKRISTALQEELNKVKQMHEDSSREMRRLVEDEATLRAQLNTELQTSSSLRIQVQEISSHLADAKVKASQADNRANQAESKLEEREKLKLEESKLLEEKLKLQIRKEIEDENKAVEHRAAAHRIHYENELGKMKNELRHSYTFGSMPPVAVSAGAGAPLNGSFGALSTNNMIAPAQRFNAEEGSGMDNLNSELSFQRMAKGWDREKSDLLNMHAEEMLQLESALQQEHLRSNRENALHVQQRLAEAADTIVKLKGMVDQGKRLAASQQEEILQLMVRSETAERILAATQRQHVQYQQQQQRSSRINSVGGSKRADRYKDMDDGSLDEWEDRADREDIGRADSREERASIEKEGRDRPILSSSSRYKGSGDSDSRMMEDDAGSAGDVVSDVRSRAIARAIYGRGGSSGRASRSLSAPRSNRNSSASPGDQDHPHPQYHRQHQRDQQQQVEGIESVRRDSTPPTEPRRYNRSRGGFDHIYNETRNAGSGSNRSNLSSDDVSNSVSISAHSEGIAELSRTRGQATSIKHDGDAKIPVLDVDKDVELSQRGKIDELRSQMTSIQMQLEVVQARWAEDKEALSERTGELKGLQDEVEKLSAENRSLRSSRKEGMGAMGDIHSNLSSPTAFSLHQQQEQTRPSLIDAGTSIHDDKDKLFVSKQAILQMEGSLQHHIDLAASANADLRAEREELRQGRHRESKLYQLLVGLEKVYKQQVRDLRQRLAEIRGEVEGFVPHAAIVVRKSVYAVNMELNAILERRKTDKEREMHSQRVTLAQSHEAEVNLLEARFVEQINKQSNGHAAELERVHTEAMKKAERVIDMVGASEYYTNLAHSFNREEQENRQPTASVNLSPSPPAPAYESVMRGVLQALSSVRVLSPTATDDFWSLAFSHEDPSYKATSAANALMLGHLESYSASLRSGSSGEGSQQIRGVSETAVANRAEATRDSRDSHNSSSSGRNCESGAGASGTVSSSSRSVDINGTKNTPFSRTEEEHAGGLSAGGSRDQLQRGGRVRSEVLLHGDAVSDLSRPPSEGGLSLGEGASYFSVDDLLRDFAPSTSYPVAPMHSTTTATTAAAAGSVGGRSTGRTAEGVPAALLGGEDRKVYGIGKRDSVECTNIHQHTIHTRQWSETGARSHSTVGSTAVAAGGDTRGIEEIPGAQAPGKSEGLGGPGGSVSSTSGRATAVSVLGGRAQHAAADKVDVDVYVDSAVDGDDDDDGAASIGSLLAAYGVPTTAAGSSRNINRQREGRSGNIGESSGGVGGGGGGPAGLHQLEEWRAAALRSSAGSTVSVDSLLS